MSRIAAHRKIDAILAYLLKQELRAATHQDRLVAETSWHLVHAAFYLRLPDPFSAAAKRTRLLVATLFPASPPLPGREWSGVEVDGRVGRQWVESALAYLHYRSGRAWRPVAQRSHPELTQHEAAAFELRMAFYGEGKKPPQPERAIERWEKKRRA